MLNTDITIGNDKNELWKALKTFSILQIKIIELLDGRGLVEVKGLIDKDNMTEIENTLATKGG